MTVTQYHKTFLSAARSCINQSLIYESVFHHLSGDDVSKRKQAQKKRRQGALKDHCKAQVIPPKGRGKKSGGGVKEQTYIINDDVNQSSSTFT